MWMDRILHPNQKALCTDKEKTHKRTTAYKKKELAKNQAYFVKNLISLDMIHEPVVLGDSKCGVNPFVSRFLTGFPECTEDDRRC